MTKTTMAIVLERDDGRQLRIGPGEAIDATRVTGLESSEVEIGMSALATVDGSSVDGVHVKPRPVHIEACYRSSKDTAADREELVRFFDPKQQIHMTVRVGSRTRRISCRLEGWTLKRRDNLDARVGFLVDLICPDPYFRSEEPVISELIRTTTGEVLANVYNDGDGDSGVVATLKAVTGAVVNPRIRLLGRTHIGIIGTVPAGSTLVINTEPRAIALSINGVSCFHLMDPASDAFTIPPGNWTVAVESDSGGMSATIEFSARYLGI